MKSILILATITYHRQLRLQHERMLKRHLSHFHPFPTSVALCGSSPLHNQHQHRTKLSTNNQDTHTITLQFAICPSSLFIFSSTENKSCLFQPIVSALHLIIPTIRFFFAQMISLVLLTHFTNPSA